MEPDAELAVQREKLQTMQQALNNMDRFIDRYERRHDEILKRVSDLEVEAAMWKGRAAAIGSLAVLIPIALHFWK